MRERILGRRQLIVLAILFEGGLAALALALGWLVNQPPLQSLHWNWYEVLWSLAATMPMLLALLVCLRWPVGPLVRVRALLDEIVRPIFHDCSPFELGVISCLAGLGEEMLFRGVLQGVGVRWLGTWASIGLLNALFGLLHLITPTYALTAALAGVYLSCLMLWKQNLLVVIIPHALFDFIALLYVLHGAVSAEPPGEAAG